MLIGLLIAYIFLGGSHQTFLLNPSLSKNVSEYVKDKNRKDQIDQTIKQILKTEETFQKKTEKETGKKPEDLNMSRSSKSADFTKEYAMFYYSLEKLQDTYLTAELKIRGLFHADEWDSIMNKALKQPPQEKINKEILAENKKLYDQLLKTCNDNITDSVNRKKAKGYADEYLVKGNTLANHS